MVLFYDIEVFKHQSCVVFKNEEGETVKIFSTNLNGLGEYIDREIIDSEGFDGLKEFIEDKVLIGYNNYHYDDYILYAMAYIGEQDLIKEWNDSIINGEKVGLKRVQTETYDAFQQIDVSMPSLKKIEGNMGSDIYESSIDFELDRPLTVKENLEVIKYCENDVLETIKIYNMRKSYFSTKATVVGMLPEELQKKARKWNTTSIIGQMLAPTIRPPKCRFVDDELLNLVPEEVKEMWLELDTTTDFKFSKKKVTIEQFGCTFEFGWGGLHAAPKGVKDLKNVKLYDVASMYPSILILHNGLGDKTEMYSQIKQDRIRIKHEGTNKALDAAYKLVLNSTYGILNNQYSQVNNPHVAYSVCIYGQISLYKLAESLALCGCKLINVNTDGVAFEPDTQGKYQDVIHEWTETFKLELELDEFSRWIQKDVNNYIAITTDGKVKTKGGDVNNYVDYEKGGMNYYFKNNNARIVQKALVDKLVYDIDIEDTVVKNMDNPILYQYILQAGNTYLGTYDNQGVKHQKVNRVFASKVGDFEIFKKRKDGGLVKFADAPSVMKLHNRGLDTLEDFEQWIDLEFYTNQCYKVYERWKT